MYLLTYLYIIFPIIILLLGPKDAFLKTIKNKKIKLWHIETIIVGLFLFILISACSYLFPVKDPSTEWIGWSALVFAHGRNSVMSRMMETQEKLAKKADPELVKSLVPCWWWAGFYFYAAESAWAIYFLKHSAYAALGGVIIFIGFFRWRKFITKYNNKD